MNRKPFLVVLPLLTFISISLLISLEDNDPYRLEKKKALDLVVQEVLHGKADTVEIIINESPRDPAAPVTLENMDGPVEYPGGWAWLVVIDYLPGNYSRHPIRWIFMDHEATRIIHLLEKDTMPRLKISGVWIGFDTLLDFIPQQQIVPMREASESPALSATTEDVIYDNYYAVIIEGDIPTGDSYNEFWLDNVIMYQTLLEKGYLPENIHVLYGYGNDETTFPCEWYQETMVDLPAYKQDVRDIFTWMRDGNPERGITRVTANDFIYLYTFDHGGSQGGCNTTLCLMDGCMPDTEFASYFNDIPYRHRAVVMQQCNSGGFIDNLQNDTTTILTAANCYQSAWEGNEYEMCNNHVMHHGEFNYWYMSAMRGRKPKPGEEPVNEDRNSDGKVSFWEAYQYVIENDDRNESPQYSDPGNIGDILSLQAWNGPTLFYQSHVIDDSGPYGNNDGIAGAGETVTMPVTLQNKGNDTAFGISGVLRSDSPSLLRITDREAQFPDIPSDETGTSFLPHYEISIDPGAVCGTMVNMTLNTKNTLSERELLFSFPIGRIRDDYPAPSTPLSIPKKTTGTVSTITVPDSFTIKDINVSVDITHSDVSEMQVILTSPIGTQVYLHNRSRPGTADIVATYDSSRVPDGPGSMNDFNGQQAQGNWALTITDGTAGPVPAGTLNAWALHIEATTAFNCNSLNCAEPVPLSVGNTLMLMKANGADLQLSWEAIAGASDYRIWKSPTADFSDEIFVGRTSGGVTSFIEAGALNDPVFYEYKVCAINSCNQEGP